MLQTLGDKMAKSRKDPWKLTEALDKAREDYKRRRPFFERRRFQSRQASARQMMVTWDELKRWKPEGLTLYRPACQFRKKTAGGGDHVAMDSPQGGKARGGGSARRDRLDRNTVLLLKNIGELIVHCALRKRLGKVSTMVMEAESRASFRLQDLRLDGTTVIDPN